MAPRLLELPVCTAFCSQGRFRRPPPYFSRFLPPATKLGQGYVFTGVCHSVNRGEYLTRYTPRSRYTSLPGTRYTPWDQVHPTRPGKPPQDQVPPPDQVHPPGTRYTPLEPGTPLGLGTPLPQTRYTPQDQVHSPSGPGTPPRTRYTPRPGKPPAQSMLGDTVNAQAIRILLECNLVQIQ